MTTMCQASLVFWKKKKGPRYILYEVADKTPQSLVPILSRSPFCCHFHVSFSLYPWTLFYESRYPYKIFFISEEKKKKRKKEIKKNNICIYVILSLIHYSPLINENSLKNKNNFSLNYYHVTRTIDICFFLFLFEFKRMQHDEESLLYSAVVGKVVVPLDSCGWCSREIPLPHLPSYLSPIFFICLCLPFPSTHWHRDTRSNTRITHTKTPLYAHRFIYIYIYIK